MASLRLKWLGSKDATKKKVFKTSKLDKILNHRFKKLLYSSMDAGKSGQSWFTDATQASVPYAPYTRVNQDHKKMK